MKPRIWLSVLLLSCQGRPGAAPCIPVDTILEPLKQERARIKGNLPPFSEERWMERSAVDAAAAQQFASAELPEEIPEEAIRAYVDFLNESASRATEMAERYQEHNAFLAQQSAQRDNIDIEGERLRSACDLVPDGCQFVPPLPEEPEGTLESLQAYVAQAKQSHLQDENAEAIWQQVIQALEDRAASMEEEIRRGKDLTEKEADFDTFLQGEDALRDTILNACPAPEPPPPPEQAPEPEPPPPPPPEPEQAPEPEPPPEPAPPKPPEDPNENFFAQPLNPLDAPALDARDADTPVPTSVPAIPAPSDPVDPPADPEHPGILPPEGGAPRDAGG